jgi:hypothetical protein
MKLLRAEARGAPTVQGMRKRALKLFARLIDSASPWLFNRDGFLEHMFDRPNSMAMDTPQPLFTGDTDPRSPARAPISTTRPSSSATTRCRRSSR